MRTTTRRTTEDTTSTGLTPTKAIRSGRRIYGHRDDSLPRRTPSLAITIGA